MAKNVRNTDKNLIFAEHFNSEQEVRRNGFNLDDSNGRNIITNGVLKFDASLNNTMQAESGAYLDEFSSRLRIMFPVSNGALANYLMNSQWGYWYLLANDVLRFRVTNTCIIEYDITSYIGDYIDVVGTCKGGEQKIYINGIEVASVNNSLAKISTNDRLLTLGGNVHPDNISWDWYMSKYEEYNKALTAEEVSNLYNDSRYVAPQLNKDKQLGIEKTLPFTNANFTFLSPPWSIDDSANVASYDSSQNGTISCTDQSDLKITGGRRYEYTFTISDCASTGGFRVTDAGGADIFNSYHSLGNGTYTFQKTAALSASSKAVGMRAYVGAAFSISNFSVKEIKVEYIKEILNVNAFSGVARNVLSGDSVGNGELITNGEVWSGTDGTVITPTGWATNRDPICTTIDGVLTMSYNILSQFWGIYQSSVMTAGKSYRIHVRWKTAVGALMRIGDLTSWFYTTGTGEWIEESFDLIAAAHGIYITEGGAGNDDIFLDYIRTEEIIPEVTNTDVEVVKEGQIRVPRFNGGTSKIDCGDYHDLLGDISIIGWMRYVEDDNEITAYRNAIIANGNLGFGQRDTDALGFSRNGYSNSAVSQYNVVTKFEWNQVAVVSDASGVTSFYVNGEDVTNTTIAGTPEVGTSNILLGEHSGARKLEGDEGEIKVVEGLLTAEEISQYYTATKHLYQK